MKPTIFVLDGGFLGLEMARELCQTGYRVVVVGHSKQDIAIYAKDVRGIVLPLPQDDSDALMAGLFKAAGDIPGEKVIIGAGEWYRKWISRYRDELSKRFKMLTCPVEEIDALLDKWNQAQMASCAGLDAPKTAIVCDDLELSRKLNYPLVVKPRFSHKTIKFRSMMGSKVIVAKNRIELKTAIAKVTQWGFQPLIQEIVPGVDYNQFLFGATVKGGKPYAVCLAQKIKADPWPFGSGVIIRTIRHDDLFKAGCRLLKESNYSGICDIEFMWNWDTGEFDFIEFNPRYGLGQRVSQMAGAGLADMAVKLAMGQVPDSQVIARPGFFWVYFDEWAKEKAWPWRNMYLRQLRNSSNTAKIFDIGDCRPELHHIKNLLAYKFKRILRTSVLLLAGLLSLWRDI